MVRATELTAERLRDLLFYEPLTGVFTWLVSIGNGVCIGDVAGFIRSGARRCAHIKVDGRSYLAHRLAHLWMTGAWPKHQIDHINMDPSDNRWANLREATNSQNRANTRVPARNKSGIKGITWNKRLRQWVAQIRDTGTPKFAPQPRQPRTRHLGCFPTPGSAALAYAIAAEKHHGEFARPTLEDVSLDIFMTEWREARWKFNWVAV